MIIELRAIYKKLLHTPWMMTALLLGSGSMAPNLGLAAQVGDVDTYFLNLARLNRYSSLEPAGSRGSLGIAVGAGGFAFEGGPVSSLQNEQLGGRKHAESDPVTGMRIYFMKGTGTPVDLGLTAGIVSETVGQQAGGHLQWTIFEGFRLPAVSLRTSYMKFLGPTATEFSTYGIDGLVSYGLLRYFTPYLGAGAHYHEASVTLTPGGDGSYLLGPAETEATIDKKWIGPVAGFCGVSLQLISPFVTAAFETQFSRNESRTYAARLSVGM